MVRILVPCSLWLLTMLLFGCRPTGGTVATHSSPGGRYTVELVGKSTAPKGMLTEHILYANARRGDAGVVRQWQIHSADMLDTAFDDEYSGAEWERESVLRFVAAGKSSPRRPDVVVIRNNSTQSVAFLTLKARDLFIAFDIPPGEALALNAPPQAHWTDLSWLAIEGQWANGERLPYAGVNFILPEDRSGRFEYLAEISDADVRIRELQQGATIYR